MDTNLYHKEYRVYMEYALQRYLIEKKGFTEYDAKIKVMQDYEGVEKAAQNDHYL